MSRSTRRPSDASYLSVDWGNPINWNHPLNRDLYAWWTMPPPLSGGTRLIDLVNANDGTLTNMDPALDWVPTDGGWGGLHFAGGSSNDHVKLTALTTPSIFPTENFTISLWAKAVNTTKTWLLGARTGSSSNDRLDLAFNSDHNESDVAGAVKVGFVGPVPASNTLQFGTAADVGVSDGEWHNTIIGADGGNTLGFISIDGLPKTVSYASQQVPNTSGLQAQLYMGGFNLSTANGAPFGEWAGTMRDVKFWSRLLSPAEMVEEYEEGRSFYPGLLNRWGHRAWSTQVVVGDLTFSINDTVSIVENFSSFLNPLVTSTFDAIAIAENVSLLFNPLVFTTFDDISISENIALNFNPLVFSVSETISITENVSTLLNPLVFTTFDSISIAENTELLFNPLVFSTFETININENINLLFNPLVINIFDAISISEFRNLELSGVDSITFSVSDSISIVENLTLNFNPLVFTTFDSISLTENISLLFNPLIISTSESISISEIKTLAVSPLLLSTSEDISIVENVNSAVTPFIINVFDSISISDVITNFLFNPLVINTFDSLSIIEDTNIRITPLIISVAEAISISDFKTLAINPLIINVFDSLSITEDETLTYTDVSDFPQLIQLGTRIFRNSVASNRSFTEN